MRAEQEDVTTLESFLCSRTKGLDRHQQVPYGYGAICRVVYYVLGDGGQAM